MIEVQNEEIKISSFESQYNEGSIEKIVLDILSLSSKKYIYKSLNQLKFELNLRKSLVNAAIDLNKSDFSFKSFRKSRCNPDFWHRTEEGGFLLQKGANPIEAIKDIYVQGSKYGTECATAIVIVYYKSLIDIFSEELFNKIFSNIYLMNWQHLDSDLGIAKVRVAKDYLPGDCRYFMNPDVNPLTPEWKGENTIDISNGSYYGHGIGIGSKDEIIEELNKHRIEGSTASSYLKDSALRPDFKYLYDLNDNSAQRIFPGHFGRNV